MADDDKNQASSIEDKVELVTYSRRRHRTSFSYIVDLFVHAPKSSIFASFWSGRRRKTHLFPPFLPVEPGAHHLFPLAYIVVMREVGRGKSVSSVNDVNGQSVVGGAVSRAVSFCASSCMPSTPQHRSAWPAATRSLRLCSAQRSNVQ